MSATEWSLVMLSGCFVMLSDCFRNSLGLTTYPDIVDAGAVVTRKIGVGFRKAQGFVQKD